MRRNLQTKKDILERLNLLGVKANRHQTKGELQKLLQSVETRKAEKQQPLDKARKIATGKGVKAQLFEMYTKIPDLALPKDELLAALPGRKWSSIATWTGKGGLGNPKYVVKIDDVPQPILIQKDENGLYRRVD